MGSLWGPHWVSAYETERWPHSEYSVHVDASLFPVFKNCQRTVEILGMKLLPVMETCFPASSLNGCIGFLHLIPTCRPSQMPHGSIAIRGTYDLFIHLFSKYLSPFHSRQLNHSLFPGGTCMLGGEAGRQVCDEDCSLRTAGRKLRSCKSIRKRCEGAASRPQHYWHLGLIVLCS